MLTNYKIVTDHVTIKQEVALTFLGVTDVASAIFIILDLHLNTVSLHHLIVNRSMKIEHTRTTHQGGSSEQVTGNCIQRAYYNFSIHVAGRSTIQCACLCIIPVDWEPMADTDSTEI